MINISKNRRHAYWLMTFLFLAMSTFVFLSKSVKAQESTSGEWINRISIRVGNDFFNDTNIWDSTHIYTGRVDENGCVDEIQVADPSRNILTVGRLIERNKYVNSGGCEITNTVENFSLTATNQQRVTAYKIADNAVYLPQSFKKEGSSNKSDGPQYFTRVSPSVPGYDQLSSEEKSRYYQTTADGSFYDGRQLSRLTYVEIRGATGIIHWQRGDGEASDEMDIVLKNGGNLVELPADAPQVPSNVTLAIGQSDQAAIGDGEIGDSEEDNSCESNSGPLGWIMCPVAGILDSITGFLDQQIEDKLVLRDSYLENEALKNTWKQIRNIAYVILIPIMLVMVIGTALGFEVFSAYTVKKALPRMIIAIIFITLSWYICVFMVQFVNTLGAGVKGLVTVPFQGVIEGGPRSSLKQALDLAEITRGGGTDFESATSGVGLGVLGAGAVVAGFATGAVSVGIIMSTLFTAALILGAVFLLLIARQMILLALLLVAPLAILSWIFPGNDKLWKLWWGGFSKLLLLFPVIMLCIAVGQIFALVVGLSGGVGNNLVETIMIIAAYILPYFFIPFLFKWAGGLFGNLAGMVNDRERGVLDRLKRGRENMRGRHGENAKNFSRFKGSNRGTQFLNNIGGMTRNRPGGYMSAKAWRTGGLDTGKLGSLRNAGQAAKAAEDLKNDKIYQDNQNNDKFLLALGDRTLAEQMRNREAEGSASRAAWDSALSSAAAVRTKDFTGTKLAAIQAHAATGYNYSTGSAGYRELSTSVIRALGGSEADLNPDGTLTDAARAKYGGNFAEAMNNAQFSLKNAGRYDMGAVNDGKSWDARGNMDKASGYESGNAKGATWTGGAEAFLGNQYLDANGKTLESDAFKRQLQQDLASGKVGAADLTEWHDKLQDGFGNPKGGNKKEIRKQILAIESAIDDLDKGATPTTPAALANVTDAIGGIRRNQSSFRGRGLDPNLLNNNT